jgi:hypothetical protein
VLLPLFKIVFDMPTATCPKCCRPVTLPMETSSTAWVRCPLCRVEYRLQEAIEFVPPVLEVLPEPTAEYSLSGATPAGAGATSVRVGRPSENQSIPDLLIDPEAATAGRSEIGDAAHRSDAPPKKAYARESRIVVAGRKRQQNPFWELVKIVIGGGVGLAIACAVLLWVFKVDLFKLAKHLPAYLVPAQLRTTDSSAGDAASANTPAASPPVAENAATAKRADPFADYQPHRGSAEKTMPPAKAAAPVTNVRPIVEGPKNGAVFTLSDVSAALAAANDAATAWADFTAETDQTDETNATEARDRFYASVAKLAETVTLMRGETGDQQAARSAVGEMLLNRFGDRQKFESLGRWAAADFANTMRPSNGIGLAGAIEEVRALGDQFRTFLRLPGRDSPISVISSQKPNLVAGDSAIVVGLVVDDPAQNIVGYDGPEESVVWGPIIVKATVR